MMTIKYTASGEQRKKLVNALSEILGCESKYLKAPSYGYEVCLCVVNRAGDIEFPDDMTEEEVEAIVKKLTWHGFERILDESEEEIGDVPILEEPALETEDPTEEMEDDATEANVEESEDVLDETVVNEDKISATENSDTSNEAPEDLAKELEEPALPEGSFESAEAAKEVTDEQSEEASIPEATEPKKIVIELPGSYLDEAELGRVRAIVASKATVLKKALETDNLSIERKENKICFPWFTDHGIDGEAKAYMQLVSGIAKRAKMLTRVTATESPSDNDKFTMRLFLVSLNFKGPEYAFARKFLLRNLSGNSGLGYLEVLEDMSYKGPIDKFIPEDMKKELAKIGSLSVGDTIFFIAATEKLACKYAGQIRDELGKRMGLLEEKAYRFCYINDFPMYEVDEETKEIGFTHNPFSMPQGGLEALQTKDPLDILAYQYDIVCNGVELSSGAVRNHDIEIMVKAFEIAGYDEETLKEKFGALYNAFQFGAPPHAGMAPGVDRMIMLLRNEENIREVIAFPMNSNAQDLMCGAPNEVTEKQLREAHIKVRD